MKINIDNFHENVGKPRSDESGKQILDRFNMRHQLFAIWAFEEAMHLYNLKSKSLEAALDIGCGGGRNISTMLLFAKKVFGIDHSPMSVLYSEEYNEIALREGRVHIAQGDVTKLSFMDERFNFITAFETIYYWPDIISAFKEVHRVLKPGGSFMIANETDKVIENESWLIEGLKIYSADEIEDMLKTVGFIDIKVIKNEHTGWLCVFGHKQ